MFDNSPQEELHLMFLIVTQHTLTRITHTHTHTDTWASTHKTAGNNLYPLNMEGTLTESILLYFIFLI